MPVTVAAVAVAVAVAAAAAAAAAVAADGATDVDKAVAVTVIVDVDVAVAVAVTVTVAAGCRLPGWVWGGARVTVDSDRWLRPTEYRPEPRWPHLGLIVLACSVAMRTSTSKRSDAFMMERSVT